MPKTDPERDARLARALRDNLRRRKAQARTAAPTSGGTPEAITPPAPEPPAS